jgi:hypothetical protein
MENLFLATVDNAIETNLMHNFINYVNVNSANKNVLYILIARNKYFKARNFVYDSLDTSHPDISPPSRVSCQTTTTSNSRFSSQFGHDSLSEVVKTDTKYL